MNKIKNITKIDYQILSKNPLIELFPIPKQPPINMRFRKLITALEEKIKNLPGALIGDCFPLKHIFAEGLYMRELTIPKGFFCVGKLHKNSYVNVILKGDMTILTEDGVRRIKAPCSNVAPSEMKRFGYSHEDTIWITVHPNPTNTTDIEKLDKDIHVEDYDDLPNKVIDIGEDADLVFNDFVKEIAKIDYKFDINYFRELTKKVFSHEKQGFWSDWTKEQQELYMSGDWEAFSRSRNYNEEEISDLRQWIDMKEQSEKQGFNPLKTIKDLITEVALKNISLDKKGEIVKSSHIPTSKKVPYNQEVIKCLV